MKVVAFLLAKYLGVSKTHDQYRQLSLTLISILSCTAVAAFFAFYNAFIDYYPPLLYVDLVGTGVGALALWLLLRWQRVQLASFVLLLMVTGVCFMVMLDRHNLDYSLAWAFVTPILSIFLLGYLYGTIYSALYLAAVMWLSGSNLGTWQPAPWDIDSFANLTVIYLLLFMLSCYYEASRRSAQRLLQESNDKLKVLATTDPLTGLFNRRYMEDLLLNSEQDVFVALADIDNFKHINDEFGHAVGDHVLTEISRIMQTTVGDNGAVGRWGGEEFLVVIQTSSEAEFSASLTHLLTRISHHSFGINRPVTISLGGTHYIAKTHRDALRYADEALYNAKTSGKNCFKLAQVA